MSTRKLILAAVLTAMAILVAGVVLFLNLPDPDDVPPVLPTTTSAPAR